MLKTLLSGDYPRSRPLTVLLLLMFLCLALGPFLFPGTRAFSTLGMICVFVIVVASYDLMLGYTHIVSFAHTMFFGIGAYGVAMTMDAMGKGFAPIFIGLGASLLVSLLLALLLGLLSLRVKAIFFALVTLAVAFAFLSLVTQLYHITGGEDGLRVRVPRELGPAFKPFDGELRGFSITTFLGGLFTDPGNLGEVWRESLFKARLTGRDLMYYITFFITVGVFLFLLRLVNSPFGRVLQAIRENEFRAQALGYRTVFYRTAVVIISALLATLAGVLFALINRYVNPENTLNFELMVFILLMCVIGGMGTLYGAVVGAVLFLLAQNYLQDVLKWLGGGLEPGTLLAELVGPERWLLWFGLLFVLSVYFFPAGIVGQLRLWARRSSSRKQGNGDDATATGEQESGNKGKDGPVVS
ncbi:Branched-chain amino acid ABC transporter, permease protein [Alloalcanivorax dieselolei B5]|uniref:Branched-chain amino acid ABC transporter, permease protein n=1 Tax=Alcanivorax dieselolei (strain DSM 16502 / CGMCC 1.3690 / MCCC 1A00001 / B-5) TaxID=930169 RepID=K0CEZ6_ALCDB|nr:branched-chain amino acid ABC transporter permease [Alloalcanivorax dieselolei]AFT70166.1 Branched-chain amino acid ABC transporter, permease protein [Alloalcanivorax dieselolei B5]GGJ95914.1 branched-chain amino acid ABC transporter permease [Alloalcanivorax dieselolei]